MWDFLMEDSIVTGDVTGIYGMGASGHGGYDILTRLSGSVTVGYIKVEFDASLLFLPHSGQLKYYGLTGD